MCIINQLIIYIKLYNLFIVHVSFAHNLNCVFSFILLEFHVPRLGAGLVDTTHAQNPWSEGDLGTVGEVYMKIKRQI